MRSTRREFLKLAAPGLATMAALRPICAFGATGTPPRGRVSLGHSLYGMQMLPLATAVAQCGAIGFRNVELILDPGGHCAPAQFSTEARQTLRRQLADLGMQASALMRNLRLVGGLTPAENEEAIKQAAGVAHAIAPDAPPPIETTLGGKPEEWATLRSQMVDRLGEWAAAAKAAGVTMVVKAHMNNAVDTPEKLNWILEQVPSPALAATYDYSHYEAHGIPLESSWTTLAPRTRFVHVKDSRTEGGKTVFLLAGEGHVDYVKLFKLIDASGYRGPVVAEVSSMIFKQPGYDPVVAARKCHDVLTRALDEAGLAHA